jgi:hypothetical protein
MPPVRAETQGPLSFIVKSFFCFFSVDVCFHSWSQHIDMCCFVVIGVVAVIVVVVVVVVAVVGL